MTNTSHESSRSGEPSNHPVGDANDSTHEDTLKHGPLSLRQQQWLALSAFVMISLVLAFAIFRWELFEFPVPRFIFATAVATYISVFFFIFYPAQFRLDRIPGINLPVRVTGPIVLWFVVLFAIWSAMPDGSSLRQIRYFDLRDLAPKTGHDAIYSDVTYKFVGPDVPERSKLHFDEFYDQLQGIYVQFESSHSSYTAEFTHLGESITVEFARTGAPTYGPTP
jgi:hypothetical protein